MKIFSFCLISSFFTQQRKTCYLLEDYSYSSVKEDPEEILDMLENGQKPPVLAGNYNTLLNSCLFAFAWTFPYLLSKSRSLSLSVLGLKFFHKEITDVVNLGLLRSFLSSCCFTYSFCIDISIVNHTREGTMDEKCRGPGMLELHSFTLWHRGSVTDWSSSGHDSPIS